MRIVDLGLIILFLAIADGNEEGAGNYEEFRIDGPNDVHNRAVDHYLEVRNQDPQSFNLSEDSPVMKSARRYAEER